MVYKGRKVAKDFLKGGVLQQQQNTIWHDQASRLLFAELVNVFYARELPQLAQLSDQQQLQRRLKSLPYYVERAATHIVQGEVPLELDGFNGCWLAKQKAQPQPNLQANQDFFSQRAEVGLVVPILLSQYDNTSVRLDTIDQLRGSGEVHCNQYGWFYANGEPCAGEDKGKVTLLKPAKPLMVAACCGHTWHYAKAAPPRRLALREMLLASAINWRQVQKTKLSRSAGIT